MSLVCTTICEHCQYGHIEEESKAKIYVTCDKHENSRWFFGQYANCDDYYKKRIDLDEDEVIEDETENSSDSEQQDGVSD